MKARERMKWVKVSGWTSEVKSDVKVKTKVRGVMSEEWNGADAETLEELRLGV